jgi:hypothetical protein
MCKFCEGDCTVGTSVEISIVGEWLRVRNYRAILNIDEQRNFLILYCPMCGKKLKQIDN